MIFQLPKSITWGTCPMCMSAMGELSRQNRWCDGGENCLKPHMRYKMNTLSSSEHWHLDLGSMQNRHFPQPWLVLFKIQNSADLNNFQYCCELGCAVSIAHLSHTENWFQRRHCSGSEQFWNRADSDQQPARGEDHVSLHQSGWAPSNCEYYAIEMSIFLAFCFSSTFKVEGGWRRSLFFVHYFLNPSETSPDRKCRWSGGRTQNEEQRERKHLYVYNTDHS